MDAISQTTFSNAFSWMKMFPIKISLKFVPKGPINNIPSLVQIMAWRRPGDMPLSAPMVVSLPTHICVARPQWVKMSSAKWRPFWVVSSNWESGNVRSEFGNRSTIRTFNFQEIWKVEMSDQNLGIELTFPLSIFMKLGKWDVALVSVKWECAISLWVVEIDISRYKNSGGKTHCQHSSLCLRHTVPYREQIYPLSYTQSGCCNNCNSPKQNTCWSCHF